jgi:hypothetical protein
MKTIEFTYNSVSEFGDAMHTIHQTPRKTRHNYSGPAGRKWFKDTPHTLNEAIETARTGGNWAAGARELQSVNVEVDSDQDYNRRAIVQDVTGFMPNVPALLANHPVAMYNQRPAPKVKRYIKIGVGIAMSSSVPASTAYNRGRALLAVIDDLVIQGYGVELWAICDVTRDSLRAKCSVKVKPADGHWSSETAAFMLACSSIVRRLWFRTMENNKRIMEVMGTGYGRPEMADTGDHDIWFPALTRGVERKFNTPEAALATVTEHIAGYLNTENAA